VTSFSRRHLRTSSSDATNTWANFISPATLNTSALILRNKDMNSQHVCECVCVCACMCMYPLCLEGFTRMIQSPFVRWLPYVTIKRPCIPQKFPKCRVGLHWPRQYGPPSNCAVLIHTLFFWDTIMHKVTPHKS
jgi:hypothetical protein